MSKNRPTGLGMPEPIGKKALFQPPVRKTKTDKRTSFSKTGRTKLPRRIRMTMSISKEAMVILQDIRNHHRLTTGKSLPLWKIVSKAIEEYGKGKVKSE